MLVSVIEPSQQIQRKVSKMFDKKLKADIITLEQSLSYIHTQIAHVFAHEIHLLGGCEVSSCAKVEFWCHGRFLC